MLLYIQSDRKVSQINKLYVKEKHIMAKKLNKDLKRLNSNPENFVKVSEKEQQGRSLKEVVNLVHYYVYNELKQKDYMRYNEYVDTVYLKVLEVIYTDNKKYGALKPVSIYKNFAHRAAITQLRYYTAKKRKDLFENMDSLDREIQNDSGDSYTLHEKIDSGIDIENTMELLIFDLKKTFGEEIVHTALKAYRGEDISKEELASLRNNKELIDFLHHR